MPRIQCFVNINVISCLSEVEYSGEQNSVESDANGSRHEPRVCVEYASQSLTRSSSLRYSVPGRRRWTSIAMKRWRRRTMGKDGAGGEAEEGACSSFSMRKERCGIMHGPVRLA